MHTHCIRQGQTEIGLVEHEGQEFLALGASIAGRYVTAYTSPVRGDIVLTTWCGQTMLSCRSEVVERYWSGSLTLLFRLTNGRFIVGYALGDDGMLFRGELLTDSDEDEARHIARQISELFAALDAEDELEFAEAG